MPDRPDLGQIEVFNKGDLKSTETREKSGAVEGFAQEKTMQEIGQFQKDKLKHAETDVKQKLPTQQELTRKNRTNSKDGCSENRELLFRHLLFLTKFMTYALVIVNVSRDFHVKFISNIHHDCGLTNNPLAPTDGINGM
uniref:Thymosin beta n=1 Tax=Ciona savignyi TaxID=51511 RepID=H2ZQC0_CIOSA